MSDDGNKLSKALGDPLTNSDLNNKKEWVKFEEEDDGTGVAASKKVFFIQKLDNCFQSDDSCDHSWIVFLDKNLIRLNFSLRESPQKT